MWPRGTGRILMIKHSRGTCIPWNVTITLDVESMYTSILHEKGLESITERFKSSYLDENVLELL